MYISVLIIVTVLLGLRMNISPDEGFNFRSVLLKFAVVTIIAV